MAYDFVTIGRNLCVRLYTAMYTQPKDIIFLLYIYIYIRISVIVLVFTLSFSLLVHFFMSFFHRSLRDQT